VSGHCKATVVVMHLVQKDNNYFIEAYLAIWIERDKPVARAVAYKEIRMGRCHCDCTNIRVSQQ
jgi:hypothetical protein